MKRCNCDIPFFDYIDVAVIVTDGFGLSGSDPEVGSISWIGLFYDLGIISFLSELDDLDSLDRRRGDVDVLGYPRFGRSFQDLFYQYECDFYSMVVVKIFLRIMEDRKRYTGDL